MATTLPPRHGQGRPHGSRRKQRIIPLSASSSTSNPFFGTIARVKVEHFAAAAKCLDTARVLEMQPQKRYTLAAAFIRAQAARTLDDLGETLIKRMTKIHHMSREAPDS